MIALVRRTLDRIRNWLDPDGLHDWIDEYGDGDWGAVWENAYELLPKLRAAESALAAVRALADSEDAQAVLFGVTGTHPETYGGVTKDEALECAGEVLTRIRAALATPTTPENGDPA